MKVIYNSTTNVLTSWNASQPPKDGETAGVVVEDKLFDRYPLSCHKYEDGHIVLTDDADTVLLNKAKKQKSNQIIANNNSLAPISWNGGVWDYAAKSDYKDVYDAIDMGLESDPCTVYDAQNQSHELTQNELKQLLQEFYTAMRARVDAGAALIDQVMACQTIAEVEAIEDDR